MNYVKIMMVKRDKREIEQLRDIIQSVAAYERWGYATTDKMLSEELLKKIRIL